MSVSSQQSRSVPVSSERTVAVEWPSICSGPWGRWLGGLYGLRAGFMVGKVPITLGWVLVALSAPFAGLLYLSGKAPRRPLLVFGPINPDCVRYRLTTERILVEHPFERDIPPVAEIGLAVFDRVDIDVLAGQSWFEAGDVVLLTGQKECLRLAGVPRPEPFVRTLLKTQQAATIQNAAVRAPAVAAV